MRQFVQLSRRCMYYKTFLQKEVLPPSDETIVRKPIYRTTTGQVPIQIYENWLEEAKSKSLTIPSPEANIPYNFEGIDTIPDSKDSFLFEEMLNQNEIHPNVLYNHLIKIYKGTVHAMENNDSEFLMEYCERNFAEKTLKALDALRSQGDKLQAFEDFSATNGQPFPYKAFFVDQLLVRGLSVNRNENQLSDYYHIFNDSDEMGVVIYTPKSLEDPKNFMNKKQSEELYADYKKVLARVLLRIQSPLRLKLIKANGQELLVDSDNYSYNHLVLFEAQCEQPPLKRTRKFDPRTAVKKFQMETYTEWLRNFVPKVWKVSDIDNWMKCNPLMPVQNAQFKDSVFKGSKYDPDVVDIRRI